MRSSRGSDGNTLRKMQMQSGHLIKFRTPWRKDRLRLLVAAANKLIRG
jgi:hypothetical protein